MLKRTKVKGQRMSCLYIHNVPANLKSYFKAYCAKQEKTMTEVITDFMKMCTKTARRVDSDESYGAEN